MGAHKFQQAVSEAQAEMKKGEGEKKPELQPNIARQSRIGSSLALKVVDIEAYRFEKYAEGHFRKTNTRTKQIYDPTKRFTYSLVSMCVCFFYVNFLNAFLGTFGRFTETA